ncbi:hypothetical protein [Runella sp.]|uniref:hypothetical protein n=1 Tax=Runella sp. TaxID=1960881 RepID=UPI003D0ECE99
MIKICHAILTLCNIRYYESHRKSIEQTAMKPIRDRLIERFIYARDQVGADWMQGAASAVSSKRRASADRLERVVLGLEKIAGIQNPPILNPTTIALSLPAEK